MKYNNNQSISIRTSKGTIEPFNRLKIKYSLESEAGLEREVAEEVASEVEIEIRHMDLDFVSAPLIREIVNVELLRLGLEKERLQYTRIGFPYKDLIEITEKVKPIKFDYEKQQFVNNISLKEVIFKRVITEFNEVKKLIKEREK